MMEAIILASRGAGVASAGTLLPHARCSPAATFASLPAGAAGPLRTIRAGGCQQAASERQLFSAHEYSGVKVWMAAVSGCRFAGSAALRRPKCRFKVIPQCSVKSAAEQARNARAAGLA